MTRQAWIAAIALALGACAGGSRDPAVQACTEAIAQRLTDKSYELDAADMAAKIEKQDGNVRQITSTVVFDKGLPAEKQQSFTCRVKLNPDNPDAAPEVIGLNFVW
jgi:hypothetical protein